VNLSNLEYAEMAKCVGLKSIIIDASDSEMNIDKLNIEHQIHHVFHSDDNFCIELKCPKDIDDYINIWTCKGLDEKN
jgi:hypothetical protein